MKLKPLKILMIMHMPWSRNFGGPRVSIELADEMRAMGHVVDKFDIHDALGPQQTKLQSYFEQVRFTRRAAEHVRRVGANYDVIQAEEGNLPFTKEQLGFDGVLVARTNGLRLFYAEYDRRVAEAARRQGSRRGTLVGNTLRWVAAQMGEVVRDSVESFEAADAIVLSNTDEFHYVSSDLGYVAKAHLAPNGLSTARFREFAEAAIDVETRHKRRTVAFVGFWHQRKGANEFPRIARRIRSRVPEANLLLLGTGKGPDEILPHFAPEDRQFVRVVSHFAPAELPRMLAKASVGLFPSHIEGFPSGVLEMLASGLPTAGYDVPGTRDMLRHFHEPMLAAAGDAECVADRITQILAAPSAEYAARSAHALDIARRFRWTEIASDMLEMYRRKMAVPKGERCQPATARVAPGVV